MVNAAMQELLTAQFGEELSSSYLYLSMAAWFERRSLKGFAHWMRVQQQEEFDHGLAILDHLLSRGSPVLLPALKAPAAEWPSPVAVFESVLEHERHITACIHRIYFVAVEQRDAASQVFLQKLVAEQVEEEGKVSGILDRLRMADDQGSAMLLLDREYGMRA